MHLSYVSAFRSFVEMYPHLAYGLVLLLAFSESLPVLGAVVPGTAIIVGLAALVPSGVLKLSPLLVAALIGAMIGDGLSFWLGHRYHEQILTRWPFRRYPQLIERSEAFFKKYGGKSVFLARFTPGVRAFVPLVAGMLKMPVGRFLYFQYSVSVDLGTIAYFAGCSAGGPSFIRPEKLPSGWRSWPLCFVFSFG
jgi:membrane protein DedA with SNARE-associated domain